jgi:hypothetical protein
VKSLLFLICALAAPARQVVVDRVEWIGLEKDRVRLALHLHVDAKEPVAIRNLRFERMTIAGMPFYLAPTPGRIEIPAAALDPIPVTIYLRDIAAVSALRQMVESGSVSIRGSARFEAELPFLLRLVLFSSTALVAAPLASDVPFLVPGGMIGRAAALAAVEAAGKAASLLRRLHRQDAWERQLRAEVLPAVFPLQTTYTIDNQTFHRQTIGFLIAPGRILTTNEAVEPWRYDPAHAASRITSTQTAGIMRILRTDAEIEPTFVSPEEGKPIRIPLARRAANRNMAILESNTAIPPLKPVNDPATQWDRLAVIRFHPEPEIVYLSGRRENGRIVFNDPINAAGSPVLSPIGLIGFVQDEYSAAPIPSN